MDEVIKCHTTNEQVRNWFSDIPAPIDDFIIWRTYKYLAKSTEQKKMLEVWIPAARKAGRLQM